MKKYRSKLVTVWAIIVGAVAYPIVLSCLTIQTAGTTLYRDLYLRGLTVELFQ